MHQRCDKIFNIHQMNTICQFHTCCIEWTFPQWYQLLCDAKIFVYLMLQMKQMIFTIMVKGITNRWPTLYNLQTKGDSHFKANTAKKANSCFFNTKSKLILCDENVVLFSKNIYNQNMLIENVYIN